jgi:hypothetical protein
MPYRRLCYLFALCASMPGPVGQAEPVPTIPKWSVYELALTATRTWSNPYLAVDLKAVFTGPGNESIEVAGFWDGGNTFRIRFTPIEEGTWTYATVSDDSGLDGQLGTIECTRPADRAHGFVRDDPQHSRIYDDGTRAGEARRAPIDPTALLGDHLDPAQLRATDRQVQSALTDGQIVEMVPFGARGSFEGTDLQDERYLRYIIARYAAYPNVIWCLVPDRSAAAPKPMQFWHISSGIVRDEDPYFAHGPLVRPLSVP